MNVFGTGAQEQGAQANYPASLNLYHFSAPENVYSLTVLHFGGEGNGSPLTGGLPTQLQLSRLTEASRDYSFCFLTLYVILE